MIAPLDQIEAQALQLPVEARAQLAERLIASLDENEIEAAWRSEIGRRVDQIAAGTAELISGEQALNEVYTSLAKLRQP